MTTIQLIDVTLRDAHQSLWSTRMTNAMMAPYLTAIDRVGFHTVDLVGGAVFDVCVRYLREDPWERMRMVTEKIRRTPVNVWLRGQSLFTFELFPDDIVIATIKHIAACGIRRITTYDALNDIRNVETSVRAGKQAGLGVTGAIVYTHSPVHTDEYYEARSRELIALGVDRLCIKDPSGLLKPERIKTLAPAVKSIAGTVPVELHSHCLSGLAPQVYVDALEHGVHYYHTATAPLANGASLPDVEGFVKEARERGYEVEVDDAGLRDMATYFRWVAQREGKPLGRLAKYDPAIYEHQVPGGMISNLRTQLAMANLENRFGEVLREVARVREDLGYPIMVSPFAQFLITQATLNVVQGERYRTVPDELKKYALGHYGRPAAPMDPEFLDRATAGALRITEPPGKRLPPALPRIRAERGPFRDNGDILLASYYDDQLRNAVLPAGTNGLRPLRFSTSPLLELLDYLGTDTALHHARIRVRDLEVTAAGGA